MTVEERKQRCRKCEYSKHVNAQNDWGFPGCYKSPYKGKWIIEIEDCPKEVENEK